VENFAALVIKKMKKRKIKFRFWCPAGKAFVRDYKYNGLVDELFDEKDYDTLVPQQFTGLIDKNGVEIYEGDLINFSCNYTVELGDPDVIEYKNCEVYYDERLAGFYFGKDGHQILDKIMEETLEVVGHNNLEKYGKVSA
jgi:uncharacterized phage protein (TIGR01671 family)